jgi:hypothetical protein
MDFPKLVEMIPADKWGPLSDQLLNFILTSKNEEKMPSKLANSILMHAGTDAIKSRSGVIALLEAAVLLEPEKTLAALGELQMPTVAEQIKGGL